jgi:RimJ/RimL family protein N-acetyltransferase
MTLRPVTSADFAFIRGLTTRPDFTPFIGDADEAQLQAWVDGTDSRVMIWQDNGATGFAVFRGLDDPSGGIELFRLALDTVGGGRGAAFFADLRDFAFRDLGAARLWLDASGENPRAMTIYERRGMRREGVLRRHWWRPSLGRAVDLHLFGLLRDEWQALPG